MQAPNFTLPNQDNQLTSLDQFRGKYVVLYFYPKDNTPGCTIEGREFTAKQEEFEKLNTIIIGVSPDSPTSHCKFQEKQGLTITLLSDEEKEVCQLYKIWQPKKFMGREFLGVVRSTFLISPEGHIVKEWRSVRVKGHVDEVLATVKEMRQNH